MIDFQQEILAPCALEFQLTIFPCVTVREGTDRRHRKRKKRDKERERCLNGDRHAHTSPVDTSEWQSVQPCPPGREGGRTQTERSTDQNECLFYCEWTWLDPLRNRGERLMSQVTNGPWGCGRSRTTRGCDDTCSGCGHTCTTRVCGDKEVHKADQLTNKIPERTHIHTVPVLRCLCVPVAKSFMMLASQYNVSTQHMTRGGKREGMESKRGWGEGDGGERVSGG